MKIEKNQNRQIEFSKIKIFYRSAKVAPVTQSGLIHLKSVFEKSKITRIKIVDSLIGLSCLEVG